MKFDDLLAQYLYENKTLQLQGIGTFRLDERVSVPQQTEKEIYYPIEGLSFTYNIKDETNEELIGFLVKRLGKIQPLVRSDVDSYLSNIRQFINIGKPYTIEGIGTLHSNNQGTYEFTPGNFLPTKEELNPKREKTDFSSRKIQHTNSDSRRGLAITLIILASLAVLGGIGWALYEFVYLPGQLSPDKHQVATLPETNTVQNEITAENNTAVVSRPASDSGNYKMIFEITGSKQRAYSRVAYLVKNKMNVKLDSISTGNSLYYRMYIPAMLRASDTSRVKDLLFKVFVRKITIAQ